MLGPGHKRIVSEAGGRKPDICAHTTDELPESSDDLSDRTPKLVVEVVSPREIDERTDFGVMNREYARLGVRRYWLVEPVQRFLVCLEPLPDSAGYPMYMSGADGIKLPVTGFPGLELDLKTFGPRQEP